MTLSDSLNSSAQKWADTIVSTKKYDHTPEADRTYGENLFWVSSSSIDAAYLADYTVGKWYTKEAPLYDYTKPGFSEATGHFTQLVWKSSTQLGCGAARGTATEPNGTVRVGTFVVCHYSPAGNVSGTDTFKNNVLAP